MLPLHAMRRARRFPVVTVTMIVGNLAVWILSELPDRAAAIRDTSFSACGRIMTQETPRSAPSPF